MRVSLVSLNQNARDLLGNVARMSKAFGYAKDAGSELVCFPELSLCGYGCEDEFYSLDFIKAMEDSLITHILPLSYEVGKDVAMMLGVPLYVSGRLYNAVLFLLGGKIVGIQCKKRLACSDVHYETRWFSPWPFGGYELVDYAGQKDIPCGDIYYHWKGWEIAVEICEEAWSGERTSVHYAASCDVVFNVSASHFALGKYRLREQLVAESSRLFRAYYLYANLLGVDSGRMVYDGALLGAFDGQIFARASRLGFVDVSMMHVDLDRSLVRSHKLKHLQTAQESIACEDLQVNALISPHCVNVESVKVEDSYSKSESALKVASTVSTFGSANPAAKNAKKTQGFEKYESELSAVEVFFCEQLSTISHQASALVVPEDYEYQELFLSLSLALFDYLRKSGGRGYVVSVSGGCDSSVVVCCVAGMIRRGVRELGLQGFLQAVHRMDLYEDLWEQLHIPEPGHTHAQIEDTKTLGQVQRYLTSKLCACVYQATKYSSQATEKAARDLCEELGAQYHCVDVQPMVDQYIASAEKLFARTLSWPDDSTVLQNIQSRVRSPLVWMLANERSAILLSTGNRSEASLGYLTMDGDSSGGLAPLASVSKSFLLLWLRWAHKEATEDLCIDPKESGVKALAQVLAMDPTAELCPPEYGQTDESDLMPYEVISALEKYRLYDKKGKEGCLSSLVQAFPTISESVLRGYVEDFDRLWCGSQWKRERLAMGFHLSEMNVDPKSGCRFPVLSPHVFHDFSHSSSSQINSET